MTKARMFAIALGVIGVVYGMLLLTGAIACTYFRCDWVGSRGLACF